MRCKMRGGIKPLLASTNIRCAVRTKWLAISKQLRGARKLASRANVEHFHNFVMPGYMTCHAACSQQPLRWCCGGRTSASPGRLCHFVGSGTSVYKRATGFAGYTNPGHAAVHGAGALMAAYSATRADACASPL